MSQSLKYKSCHIPWAFRHNQEQSEIFDLRMHGLNLKDADVATPHLILKVKVREMKCISVDHKVITS